MKNLKILSASLLLALSIAPAQAEILQTDLHVKGDGLATLDTSTGLEWLDLSQTENMSYNQVTALLDSELSGWRLPTFNEVRGLISSFFDDFYPSEYKAGFSVEQRQFWEYSMGLVPSSTSSILAGMHLKEGSTTSLGFAGARSSTGNSSYAYLDRYSLSFDHTQVGYGVFLVSDGGTTLSSINNPNINLIGFDGDINASVPISLSGGLLALGLLGLRRKSKD